jgi:catechol 2,3-dioxygenase
MQTTTSSPTPATAPTLPDALALGAVHLTVSDLARSVAFYEASIGLTLHGRDGSVARLGAGGDDLLVLVEEPDARTAGRHAGLYHFALLHPSRLELARAALRLAATHTPISGASDHGISEAIYLPDPDDNGIELAADRGREHWGDLRDTTTIGGPEPLDLASLMSLVANEEVHPHVDPGTTVGHVHLHVGDIDRGIAFYRDVIGFEVMTLLDSAAFVAAGGYHHHLGFNVWRGRNVPPFPAGTVGLNQWTIVLPADAAAALRERVVAAGAPYEERPEGLLVRDPWEIPLLVVEG